MTKEELWQAVLAQIQLNISEANFATWFKKTKIFSRKRERIIISVPNSFTKEWLENKYQKNILEILYHLDREIRQIEYVVGKTLPQPVEKNLFSVPGNEQIGFKEFQYDQETNLNPRYTFKNFVVGSFNELPNAAARAVVEKPGLVYNPLFIYGDVGLGKTHLLQAIGNEIDQLFSKKKIEYIPAEKFISEVVSAIRNQTIEELKKRYRRLDVLIIDDVQFLAGKDKTQEEFFHLFNSLYERNKQIILSSDRPAKAIPALFERVRSRFEGGITADIGYPDFETRVAILKDKTSSGQVEISEEVLQFVASQIKTNIRELEGALSVVILSQKTKKDKKLDVAEAKAVLKKFSLSPAHSLTPQNIIKTVADFYDLKEKDLLSTSRRREIVRPRQIAMYLMRREAKNSYPFIAKKFNGRDHTTAIYAYQKISQELTSNESLERDLNLIKMHLFNLGKKG